MPPRARLITLGTLCAASDAGPLTGAAAQRKPLALLAVLAAAGDRGVTREKLYGFFWPEADTERASHGLAQMLYGIRRHFADADVVQGTTTLRLNPASVATDLEEFDRALAGGNLECAVSLYRGPFLDGIYLRDAPPFERWAEEERSRLADRYRSALEGLATEARAAGDLEGAVARWRQIATLDPLGTRSALGLMRALAEAGDRAGALQHAHVHEMLVRQELECDPDPSVTALCAELRDGHPRHASAHPTPRLDGRQPPASATIPSHPALDKADLAAPSGVALGAAYTQPSASDGARWLRGVIVAGATALAIATLVVGAEWNPLPRPSPTFTAPLDANRIVVLPFRVTSADSALRHLSDAVAELLAAAFTGEGGAVAVDPRTTLALRRRVAIDSGQRAFTSADIQDVLVARAAGAGALLRGEIVRTNAARIVLNAVVVAASDGRTLARASVQGERDSIPRLVDGLAAQLLAVVAGEGGEHLPQLTSTPLPALRAYLAGRAAHRHGDDRAAVAHFSRALELDSTFALAGLELAAAAGPIFKWTIWVDSSLVVVGQRTAMNALNLGDEDRVTWALERGWQLRDRLSEGDRAYLMALRGEHYPLATSAARLLAGWERATRASPDRADAWCQLGDILLTQGASLGLAGARARAASVFRRARELDSALVAPVAGLLEIAAFARDRDEVRRLGTLYLRMDSTSERAEYIRWRVATIVGDSVALQALRSRFDELGLTALDGIQRTSQVDGVALEDADRAMSTILHRAAGREQRRGALFNASRLSLNRGRPREAARQNKLKLELEATPTVYLNQSLNYAIHWEGDSLAAVDAARHWETEARRADMWVGGRAPHGRALVRGLIILAHWRLWQGDTASAARLLRHLRRATPTDTITQHSVLMAMLAAEVGVAARQPNARQLVDRLDTLALDGCCGHAAVNLVIAHLRETIGDIPGALRAVRRGNWSTTGFLSTYLREEGRLAARAGDRAGAIRAYRHFLLLRYDPEPARVSDTERIREALREWERPVPGGPG
ncbi:MAG: hypothetical protein NVS1B4_21490 [Gemmatimonadaceae bacterium]